MIEQLFYIANSLKILLLFIPGILLVKLIKMKFGKLQDFSTIDDILVGITFWSYIFFSISLLLGILTVSLNILFSIFFWIGIFITVAYISYKIYSTRRSHDLFLSNKLNYLHNWIALIIALLFIQIILANFSNPIANNWDAISLYLPIGKGIATSGSLNFIPIYPEIVGKYSSTFEPLMPLFYAWTLSTSGNYLRMFPLIWLSILLIASYGILKTLGYEKPALSSLIILSMPGILILTAYEGLLLDLPAIAYIAVAFYFLNKWFKDNFKNTTYLILTGFSITLASAAKLTAFPFIMLMLALLILLYPVKDSRQRKITILLASILPSSAFLLHSIMGILDGVFYYHSIKLIVISVFALFFSMTFSYLFPKKENASVDSVKHWLKITTLYVVTLTPLMMFILRNAITLNVVTIHTGTAISEAIAESGLGEIFFSGPISLIQQFRFEGIFLNGAWGGMFFLPIIIGLYRYLRRARFSSTHFTLLLAFLQGTLSYSYMYDCNSFLFNHRALAIFAPIFPALIIEGIFGFRDFFKNRVKHEVCVIVYVMLALTYNSILLHELNIFNKASLLISLTSVNWLNIMHYALLPFLSLIICLTMLRLRVKIKISNVTAIVKRASVITLILVSIIAVAAISPIANYAGAILKYDDLSFFDKMESYSLVDPAQTESYTEVINFFRANPKLVSHKEFIITTGFFFLPYFTDLKIIDTGFPASYPYLSEMLMLKDGEQITAMLKHDKVNWFLIPKSNIPDYGAYVHYTELRDRSMMFKLVGNENYMVKIAEFKYSVLWKLT